MSTPAVLEQDNRALRDHVSRLTARLIISELTAAVQEPDFDHNKMETIISNATAGSIQGTK